VDRDNYIRFVNGNDNPYAYAADFTKIAGTPSFISIKPHGIQDDEFHVSLGELEPARLILSVSREMHRPLRARRGKLSPSERETVAGAGPEHCWVKFSDSKKTDFIIGEPVGD